MALQAVRDQIETLLAEALTVRYGVMDPASLAGYSDRVLSGKEVKNWSLLTKTVVFELWFRTQQRYLIPVEFQQQDSKQPLHPAHDIRIGSATS